jgi:hypothetical protein
VNPAQSGCLIERNVVNLYDAIFLIKLQVWAFPGFGILLALDEGFVERTTVLDN